MILFGLATVAYLVLINLILICMPRKSCSIKYVSDLHFRSDLWTPDDYFCDTWIELFVGQT
jgi:hypothetical protein